MKGDEGMFSGFYIDLDEKIFVGKSLKQYSKTGKNHLREAKQKYDIRLDDVVSLFWTQRG